MHDDVIACAELVRKGDPDRFLAVMAAPAASRARLFPVYAFNIEVARAPWVTAEPMIAEMRLQWWYDALGEIAQGDPVRRHEVVTPLSQILDSDGAVRLQNLVQARRWDIYKDPFDDMDHFHRYLSDTTAGLLLAAARALGPAPEDVVLQAGRGLAIANWLRAIPALESSGRIPLVEGTPAAIRSLAREGLDHLARSRRARSCVPAVCRPAMLGLWRAGSVLRQAHKHPGRVAQGRLDPSPFRSRISLMARAATGRW